MYHAVVSVSPTSTGLFCICNFRLGVIVWHYMNWLKCVRLVEMSTVLQNVLKEVEKKITQMAAPAIVPLSVPSVHVMAI